MLMRQICSLVVLVVFVGIAFLVYSHRVEYGLANAFGRPFFHLAIVLVVNILLLTILLATPITNIQLIDVYNIVQIVFGSLLLIASVFFYQFRRYETTKRLHITDHPYFTAQVGIAHLAIATACITAGAIQEGALVITLLVSVWGWGSAWLHILRAFGNLVPSPPSDLEAGDNVAPLHGETVLHCAEFYINVTVPILFLTLYIFGPGLES